MTTTKLHPLQIAYAAATAALEVTHDLFEDGEATSDELDAAFALESDAQAALISWGLELTVAAAKKQRNRKDFATIASLQGRYLSVARSLQVATLMMKMDHRDMVRAAA